MKLKKEKLSIKRISRRTVLLCPIKENGFSDVHSIQNPNRAFTLDSLFQEELKSEGIIAQTAVSFSQGDSLVSCSNKLLSQAGIALDPIVFGVEQDQRQIELQAYVLFPHSYLFSRMPLIWGLILLWCILVIIMYIWQRRKKVEYNKAAVTPVTPVPVAFSSDASEWIEIAQDVFFSKKTGELKDQDHKVFWQETVYVLLSVFGKHRIILSAILFL